MDAFCNYPVMRWAIDDVGADYDRRLRVMMDVFAASVSPSRAPVPAGHLGVWKLCGT